ncbi:MAG TPA: branched-chain amino acid ABC transporter permease [Salinisphaeraceae bacterium]|nr:branched-chain amino acid ABC transporter permease [Salinisphaeraceae bacterium]
MELINLLNYALFFLTLASVYAILTLALNLQWGLTGLFNLGIAGFFAVGAYTSAILTTPEHAGYVGGFDLPIFVGAIAAMITSSIVAVIIGLITVRLRTDYLAIASIGVAEIIRLYFKNAEWLTNGVRGIPGIPRPFGGQPVLLLLLLLAIVIAVYFLVERARISPWGRVLRAQRENEDGTLAAGKNTNRFRLESFVVGSALMGLAGALYAHFIGFITPQAFQPLYGTFLVWVMLIAGGSGNTLGALLGGFAIWLIWSGTQILADFLPSTLSTQAGAVRVLLIGLLLEIVLLLRPQGLIPEKRTALVPRKKSDKGKG